jgi:hypothetical protein
MDNNYRTILATLQKSSPTPAANQRTFFYPIKLMDFFFSIERKKLNILCIGRVQPAAKKIYLIALYKLQSFIL